MPPFATFFILIITGICTYRGFKDERFLQLCIFDPSRILKYKEYHRIVTPGLIHADWMHLLFNAFSFYSFATGIEQRFGIATLIFIYGSSIIGGNLLALYLHRHHEYRALGASGGVCGVIFASIFLFPNSKVSLFFIPIGIPASIYAILFLAISMYGIKAARDTIGHDAHLGGAIVGLLITTICYPYIIRQNPALYAAVILISLGILAYLLYKPGLPRQSLKNSFQVIVNAQQQRKEAIRAAEEFNQERVVDRILEKISSEGVEKLTENEKDILKKASARKKNQHTNPDDHDH